MTTKKENVMMIRPGTPAKPEKSGFSSKSIRSVMAEDMCRGFISEGNRHIGRRPSLDDIDRRSG